MRSAAVVANLSILLTFILAAILNSYDEHLYYLSVQEDGYVEWATFWGFVVAAWIFAVTALHQLKVRRQLPWFMICLTMFCFFVAMEEISWGQRLLDYRAPEYFLEQNYQQEFNLHNIAATRIRKLVLQAILLGYGVILSATAQWAPAARLLKRCRIVVSPPSLIVGFLAMYVVYVWYPWSHTGEWVELAMAYGFAYVALFSRSPVAARSEAAGTVKALQVLAIIWALAASTVIAVRYGHAADPDNVNAARFEIDALAKDFNSGHVRTRCNIHKRLFTFAREYRQPYLFEGEYSQLLQDKGAGDRAEYLLDPWNSAYWIRHKCTRGRESRFIYSFGPDRRRDSTAWELGGDDIGAHLRE